MKLFKNKKGDVAHPWFALLIILLLLAVAVNFIPSGEYTRVAVNGRMVVDPDSFRSIDKIYSGIGNFFVSFYEGFCNAAGLIAMVFFVGAGFGVVKRIGLLQTTISAATKKTPFCSVILYCDAFDYIARTIYGCVGDESGISARSNSAFYDDGI